MPDVRVVAVIAAFNEEDIIGEAVGALIDEGVSVYAIDHGSDDGTIDVLRTFEGRGVVGIETYPRVDGRFDWAGLLARKQTLAGRLDADWFIHHDADEFRESPWPGVSLSEALQRVEAAGCNAVDFEVLHFWPTSTDADTPVVRERLLHYEPARAWDQVQVKCWKNTGQPVDLVTSGGHDVSFAGRRVFPIPFLLRHYPIRSQAHGERKVFRERIGRFVPAERERGWHVQYDAYREGDRFVRDPASLARYEEGPVKQALWSRHRDVDRVERERAALASAHAALVEAMAHLEKDARANREDAEGLRTRLAELETELDASNHERARLRGELEAIRASWSWRLTRPLRRIPPVRRAR